MPPGNCGISERSYNDVAARIDDFIWCQWAEVGRLTWHGDDEGLGLMLSGSYDRRSLSQQGLGTFSGYTRYKDSSGTVRYGNSDARPEEIQEHRQNTGLDAAVQWRPTADTEITAQLLLPPEVEPRALVAVVHAHRWPLQCYVFSRRHPALGHGHRARADQHRVREYQGRRLILGTER